MKKLKIDTLAKLELFVENEKIPIEDRLTVFQEALSSHSLFILEIKYNDECNKIEDPAAVLKEMLLCINAIKKTSTQPHFAGFTVQYFKN